MKLSKKDNWKDDKPYRHIPQCYPIETRSSTEIAIDHLRVAQDYVKRRMDERTR